MPKDVAKKNKEIRREALREELKSREYIRQVHKILDTDDESINVPAAKLKLDAYFKLLSKTLPDVKAVEMTGRDGEKLFPESIKVIHE